MTKIRKIYTLDPETVKAIEEKRGLVTASAFVNDLIKKALGCYDDGKDNEQQS